MKLTESDDQTFFPPLPFDHIQYIHEWIIEHLRYGYNLIKEIVFYCCSTVRFISLVRISRSTHNLQPILIATFIAVFSTIYDTKLSLYIRGIVFESNAGKACVYVAAKWCALDTFNFLINLIGE